MAPSSYTTLLPATAEAPTEVCLTLYYERPAAAASIAPCIRTHLMAAVDTWELFKFDGEASGAAEHRALYKAVQPPAGFSSLYCQAFAPALSLHTEIVQLILSSDEAYDTAWPQAATWLADTLAKWLRPGQAEFLGYTLVYRANAVVGSNGPSLAPEVLAAVRSVNGAVPQSVSSPVLTQQPQAGQGWLLLLQYPQAQSQGLIYLALGTGHQPDELTSTVCFGPQRLLPCQDVFVHKTLQQYHLVNSDYDTYDAQILEPFKKSITELLSIVDDPRQKAGRLDDLAQRLADLTRTNWDLNRVDYSLQQQANGLKRLFSVSEMSAIARRHLASIESHGQEIHALVVQHQLLLENARVAISLVEAQESKHASTIQNRFNQLLAIGGLLFGAYSAIDMLLIEKTAISGLLWYWLYAIRFLAAVAVTGFLVSGYLLIRRFNKNKRTERAIQHGMLPA